MSDHATFDLPDDMGLLRETARRFMRQEIQRYVDKHWGAPRSANL